MVKILPGRKSNLALWVLIILTSTALAVFFFVFKKTATAPMLSPNSDSSSSAKVATKAEPKPPDLTLENIFAGQPVSLSDLDQSKIVTLIATGDVIPARGANYPPVKSGNFHYNWEKTRAFLKAGDITLINLEAPIIKGCPLISTGFTFCGDSRHIQGIVWAGVDVASLANNHIGNFGSEGISETIEILERAKVEYSGFGHLGRKKVKGVSFGFLAYNGIGVKIDRAALASEIKKAKPKVDILVVSVHWGKEYESLPMTDGNIAPDDPVELGHLMIDSGADLVVGNHPHWVQGVEIYQPKGLPSASAKGKLITYAHGNFIFDQTWSAETQEGVVGTYSFYKGELVRVHYTPIKVGIKYQPFFATGKTATKILKQMVDSSKKLAK
ncbi:MAG: CapA family protein [bacterium]|nr:CapA family protein [bacterium]